MTLASMDAPSRVAAVRRFNRFYTRQIGLLQEKLLHSAFSLTEMRLLYELAHTPDITATELTRSLGLDAGYTSRILKKFEERGLVRRTASSQDARRSHLELTAKGRKTFEPLNAASDEQVHSILSGMAEADQSKLVSAMSAIEQVLEPSEAPKVPYILRTHQPGDMGWVTHRHAVIYSRDYGWTDEFEALVAEIVAKFIRNFDARRERCWIAEREGEIVGSVFLVKESDEVARLRLLLVEQSARGLGIGARLVKECIDFAKRSGYRKITLWTNDILHAARKIYEAEGFKLVKETKHHSFGADLTAQDWDLDLSSR
jgi:DNA-binding MarR family transcriptional regulator/GNAT superfamily N-acetyltransferase